jgi:hypothetical protein
MYPTRLGYQLIESISCTTSLDFGGELKITNGAAARWVEKAGRERGGRKGVKPFSTNESCYGGWRDSYVSHATQHNVTQSTSDGTCLLVTPQQSTWSWKSSNILPLDAYKFNSLLIVPKIQPGGIFKYFSHIFFFFSYTILLPSFAPFLRTSSRIPHGHQTPPNHNVLYAIDKDIFKVINDKQNDHLEISQCELTHASSSPTTLSQK